MMKRIGIRLSAEFAKLAHRAGVDKVAAIPPGRVDGKLRLGYTCADFHDHPLSYAIQGIVAKHERSRFEVIGYAFYDVLDFQRANIEQVIGREQMVPMNSTHTSLPEAVRRIEDDGIHILLNLNFYTKRHRTEIFALRPSPIQLAMVGSPNTMGASFVEYNVVDTGVVPPEAAGHMTEKLVYQPHTFHASAYRGAITAVPATKPVVFLFATMNCMCKLDPMTYHTWLQALRRTRNLQTELLLLQNPKGGNLPETLRAEAASSGVLGERIKFVGFTAKREEHLYRMRIIDLHLDPLAINGGSTTLDALFEATPMLSVPGNHMGSRFGGTALRALGMGEDDTVLQTRKQYEDAMVALVPWEHSDDPA